MENKILMSVREFMLVTGLGETTVYKMFNEGTLKRVRIGRRTFVRTADVHALIEASTVEPAAA
jgi:excisionase family DNA binding protein